MRRGGGSIPRGVEVYSRILEGQGSSNPVDPNGYLPVTGYWYLGFLRTSQVLVSL